MESFTLYEYRVTSCLLTEEEEGEGEEGEGEEDEEEEDAEEA